MSIAEAGWVPLFPGRLTLLSAAGSAAVLFNGIKESWRLARKILSHFKFFFFIFPSNAQILLRVMSCMAGVHEVSGTTAELQEQNR